MKISVDVFNEDIEKMFEGEADIPQDGIGHEINLRSADGKTLPDFRVQLDPKSKDEIRCFIGRGEGMIRFFGFIILDWRVDFLTPQNFRTGKFVKTPWKILRMEVG